MAMVTLEDGTSMIYNILAVSPRHACGKKGLIHILDLDVQNSIKPPNVQKKKKRSKLPLRFLFVLV